MHTPSEFLEKLNVLLFYVTLNHDKQTDKESSILTNLQIILILIWLLEKCIKFNQKVIGTNQTAN